MKVDLDEARPARRHGRVARIVAAIGVLLIVALVGLWLERKPIASDVIDRELARAGVPARYRIVDLGLGRQRLADVVIGNPRRPDLIADWIELGTRIGLDGATVTAVRGGHVRVAAKLIDGRLSLGTIDRLLPAPSGQPFALPAIDLDLVDGRMRLDTPDGVIGVKLAGRGRLDGGFTGSLAAVSERISASGCSADRLAAVLAIRVSRTIGRRADPRVAVNGPVRVAGAGCGETRLERARADVEASYAVAGRDWRGQARLVVDSVRDPRVRLAMLTGTVGLAGTGSAVSGPVALMGRSLTSAGAAARFASMQGRFAFAGGRARYQGHVAATGARLGAATIARLTSLTGVADGTPLAPLAAAAIGAGGRAARDFAADADVALSTGPAGLAIIATTMRAHSASGVRATFDGGTGVRFERDRLQVGGRLALAGGGLPELTATLDQAAPGAAMTGVVTMARYAAGGASLAVTPVRFTAAAGSALRVKTMATLSGPVANGRIDGLTMPIAVAWDSIGGLVVNPACAPLAIERLAAAGLVLAPARLTVCPVNGALLRLANGRVSGGAALGVTRMTGRLGSTPLTVAAEQAQVTLADPHFALRRLSVRLGPGDRVTRLDLATIDGRVVAGGVTGAFTGGAGQIGAVPLLLSAADGRWTLRGGALAVDGAMTVADSAPVPRFQPLAARTVTLALKDGAIAARGTLFEPTRGVKVADVTLTHALSSGRGAADLVVPGIAFNTTFQPELLTRLTFGVIADVAGTISGEGHIAWSADGVTSTGRFTTAGTDLAAAFGPVTGVAGTISFTNLLALQSAPGQVATIRTINPGIPVTDGTITYQTLPDARVQVESGRWPFAGGRLTLEPTLLDFSAASQRRMTFRVDGMDAGKFLDQFDFKNLDASGTFDGVLPMVFDTAGGRIEAGHLVVREGGGTIAYVGDLSQKDLGFWSNLAFQALKSLKYRNLAIDMNGPLAGEMITQVRFAGISQGAGAKSNFLIRRLQKLPFVFNVRIAAPFRGLIDSAQSFYDPKRLIERNLPSLLEAQDKAAPGPVQPPASGAVPLPKQD